MSRYTASPFPYGSNISIAEKMGLAYRPIGRFFCYKSVKLFKRPDPAAQSSAGRRDHFPLPCSRLCFRSGREETEAAGFPDGLCGRSTVVFQGEAQVALLLPDPRFLRSACSLYIIHQFDESFNQDYEHPHGSQTSLSIQIGRLSRS